VGCSAGVVIRVQMASPPLMLLLPSILLAASDVLAVAIDEFSTATRKTIYCNTWDPLLISAGNSS
jgi:hypothetical protein